jgi:hypothetical protein
MPATPIQPIAFLGGEDGYVPGACNIGPWEIRRRRVFALASFIAALLLFGVLVAVDAPGVVRGVVLFPLWGGFFSWLQARRRFCAAFAMAGVANFADADAGRHAVADKKAHNADMAAVARMARDSFLLAVPVTLVAALLPI